MAKVIKLHTPKLTDEKTIIDIGQLALSSLIEIDERLSKHYAEQSPTAENSLSSKSQTNKA